MNSAFSLTLVTPVLNGADHIERALKSVTSQGIQPLEHLVYDAGSTDSTQEIIRRYPHCTLIEEPDEGAHDAMNKGIARARGDWIAFLNEDDLYLPDAFEKLQQAMTRSPDAEMIMTGSRVCTIDAENGQSAKILIERPLKTGSSTDPVALTLGVPCLNARFFRTKTLCRENGFNNDYYVSADRHLLLKLAVQQIGAVEIPDILFEYGVHGGSQTLRPTPEIRRKITTEHMAIADELIDSKVLPAEMRQVIADWLSFEQIRLQIIDRSTDDSEPGLRPYLCAASRQPWKIPSLARSLRRKRALAHGERRADNARALLS